MILNRESDKLITQFDNKNKSVFKKYIPISELDKKWGFTINDAGHTKIKKNSEYPLKGHPGSHMFSWENGRILDEYHIVIITDGQGIFESKSAGLIKISKGDTFLLFPGEWHRYKPLKETGWTESWVGFSGKIPDVVMQDYFFTKENPVIHKCNNTLVLNLLKSLLQLVAEEPYGFQRMASGICLQLIAEIYNIQKGTDQEKLADTLISRAKFIMQSKIGENIDFRFFAKNNGISYSKFRIDFKRQTGLAPLQYHLLLKIEKAKDLLQNTSLRSKQIAFDLGFESDHYFCRFFKQKTGITPQQFRAHRRAMINY